MRVRRRLRCAFFGLVGTVAVASSADRPLLQGVAYGPAPLKELGTLANDDFMSDAAKAQWSSSGRGDLAIMKALGANAVRLYGNDGGPQIRPGGFLDKNGSYHPALKRITVINEPDLKIGDENSPVKNSRAHNQRHRSNGGAVPAQAPTARTGCIVTLDPATTPLSEEGYGTVLGLQDKVTTFITRVLEEQHMQVTDQAALRRKRAFRHLGRGALQRRRRASWNLVLWRQLSGQVSQPQSRKQRGTGDNGARKATASDQQQEQQQQHSSVELVIMGLACIVVVLLGSLLAWRLLKKRRFSQIMQARASLVGEVEA
ncbi:unnamed protein product [Polarella glacialis]|uniref:Subtilisin n=1 Tax=Polarella glacialis TaxID=89957 RepID=A0A813KNT1_POLGL|nr:unnamed protein product [Polarella glacialis]